MDLHTRSQGTRRSLIAGIGLIAGLALAAAAMLGMPAAAAAQSGTGGITADGDAGGTSGGSNDSDGNSNVSTRVERVNNRTVAGRRARLRNGLAVAPRRAPRRVKRVIWAANEIATGKGYCWGGGHGRLNSSCYDCSGAASYALRGGNFVRGSMPSGGYFSWGKRGRGQWITVFTNSGHMYITVAGLRFDTGMVSGRGPSWSNQMRSSRSFRARHHPRF